MNKFIGTGRLTKDPEMHYTQSGKCMCKFTLAIDGGGKNDDKNTVFLPVVAWEKMGEACGNHLVKGQAVVVEGRVQIRAYDAQDGTKKYFTEIVAQNVEFGAKPKGQASDFGGNAVEDEEIPF